MEICTECSQFYCDCKCKTAAKWIEVDDEIAYLLLEFGRVFKELDLALSIESSCAGHLVPLTGEMDTTTRYAVPCCYAKFGIHEKLKPLFENFEQEISVPKGLVCSITNVTNDWHITISISAKATLDRLSADEIFAFQKARNQFIEYLYGKLKLLKMFSSILQEKLAEDK